MSLDAAAIDLRPLTTMPVKLEMYPTEEGGYLGSGLAAGYQVFGPALPDVLSEVAVLVVQPDAIARRQVGCCVSFLRPHGLVPVTAVPFVLELPMARALWRFQFNAVTADSLAIGEGVYCHGPSLMLLLRDVDPVPGRPACVRLAGLKGSSDPARRGPQHLRTALTSINRVFGAVHCPDEPLDILREVGVMFTGPALVEVFETLRSALDTGSPYDVDSAAESVYASAPAHDLDVARATERLLAVLDADGSRPARRLAQRLDAARRQGTPLDWLAFADGLTMLGVDPRGWDPLLAGSAHVRYELPDTPKLIPSFSGS